MSAANATADRGSTCRSSADRSPTGLAASMPKAPVSPSPIWLPAPEPAYRHAAQRKCRRSLGPAERKSLPRPRQTSLQVRKAQYPRSVSEYWTRSRPPIGRGGRSGAIGMLQQTSAAQPTLKTVFICRDRGHRCTIKCGEKLERAAQFGGWGGKVGRQDHAAQDAGDLVGGVGIGQENLLHLRDQSWWRARCQKRHHPHIRGSSRQRNRTVQIPNNTANSARTPGTACT